VTQPAQRSHPSYLSVIALALMVAIAAALAGCRREPHQPTLVEAARLSMGTELHL